jgi:2-keto-4-pentenoate hydratase/2-oxohepta-3-ene-1,7-dioic acid hydratase in catechol pathway
VFGRHDGQRVLKMKGDPFAGELGVTDEPVQVARLLAPVAPPNIFAIGMNYREHARETGREVPGQPVVFMKAVTSLNHPDSPIVLPAVSSKVDYEAELAVVIGRQAKNVSQERALDYVLGYTCANDVSERYWQRLLGQWVRGKSFDTFCPLGPWIETEIATPDALRVSCRLNGLTMQDSTTADMIFSVSALISFLSQDLTLLPGTVILTGTPPGVGEARNPPVFLKGGDRVTVAVEGIGELSNPVLPA